MTAWSLGLTIFLAGYLLGSIPFCYIIGKLYGVDIRTIGSGNVGGTNLRRGLTDKPGGSFMAVLGLVLDGVKGYVAAAWIVPVLGYCMGAATTQLISTEWAAIIGGAAAVIGHSFTVFLKFKGGKGVATGAGMLVAICWPAAIAGLVVFLIAYLVSRISSVGSLSGAASVPVAAGVYYHYTTSLGEHIPALAVLVAVVVLVFVRHHANIRRLMHGEELNFREPTAAAPPAEAPGAVEGTKGIEPGESAEAVERPAH